VTTLKDNTGTVINKYFSGITSDASGNLYASIYDPVGRSSQVYKISNTGVVTFLAGAAAYGKEVDGTGTAAVFGELRGVAIDAAANVYVASYGSSRIKKITQAGVVSTLAGSSTADGYPLPGSADGVGTAAGFSQPSDLFISGTTMYVVDKGNYRIRKIDISQSTLSFNSNGGSDVADVGVFNAAPIVLPTAPTKPGFAFAGWYTDSAATTTPLNLTAGITANTVVYAKWATARTLTLQTNQGSLIAPMTVADGTAFAPPAAPTKSGFTFVRWCSDSGLTTAFDFTKGITADATIYAQWGYTLTFNTYYNVTVAPIAAASGAKITQPATPAYAGQAFVGWFTTQGGSTLFNFNTGITANTTVYAKWATARTLTFVSNGGPAKDPMIVANGTAITLTDPSWGDYVFGGWYTDTALTTAFNASAGITVDTTVYAKWYVNIPDGLFESALYARGFDDTPFDNKVPLAKVTAATATSLNITNSNAITDMTGIKAFTSLQTLVCSGNTKLASLDVSGMTALTSLTCNNNSLMTTLNVSGTTALTTLICNSNALLTSLDVSGLTSLTSLTCGYNAILTSLDASGLTALTSLTSTDNAKLTSLNVSGLTSLTTLTCNSNALTSLDARGLTALTALTCNTNALTSLNVSGLTNLTSLICPYNAPLTTLDASGLTKLTSMQAYNCSLTTLNVSGNTALTSLDCSRNKITSLDLSTNTALISLDCSYNNLTSLNVKNGNNGRMSTGTFTSNKLTCILADSTAPNSSWTKDSRASYSTDCPTLGITDVVFGKMAIYPNPSKGEIHIDNVTLQKATVYDASGKLIQSVNFKNASDSNTLNLNAVAKGIYYLFIESEGGHTAKKIIIE
jgi:uncharacterized repeat protein (TIGR02543 family)